MNIKSVNNNINFRPDEQEIYLTLKRDLSWREGFGILFVRCTYTQESLIIKKIKQDIPEKKIDVLFLDDFVDNLYDLIEKKTQDKHIDILFISGIENSLSLENYIKGTFEQPRNSYNIDSISPLLGHLNWQRERFRDNFNCCLVFTVRTYTLKYLVRRAPDFFDWRSGVIEFPANINIDRLQLIDIPGLDPSKSTISDFISSSRQAKQANNNPQNHVEFVKAIFEAESNKNYDRSIVFTILQDNLDKLDENFTRFLQQWIINTCYEVTPEEIEAVAELVEKFCLDVYEFPLGVRANNLEIVISILETVLKLRPRETYPQKWATIQHNLATFYSERIKGDRADNIEKAISSYKGALQIRTVENFPYEWSITLNNLATAYRDRIQGDKSDNIEKAISCYQKALQIRTVENFPYEWAITQNNLATAYIERTKGNRLENLERGIVYYQEALKVFTIDTFPYEWAITKKNLAIVYSERTKGDKAENLEIAISYLQEALKVITLKSFPYDWSKIQHNLAKIYSERIKEDKVNNIEKAAQLYRNSLQIWTSESFPLEYIQTGKNLGDLGFTNTNWKIALEGYSIAIEALETSRTWTFAEIRRSEIMEESIGLYQNIIQVYINIGQTDKAFEYCDRSKAKTLVEILATRDIYPKGDIPKDIIKELDRLRREIVVENKNLLNQEYRRFNHNEYLLIEEKKTLQSQFSDYSHLNKLIKELEELIVNYILPTDPSFNLTQKLDPIRFDEIKNLIDDKTLILYWYLVNDKLYTFIIDNNVFQPILLEISSDNLRELNILANKYLELALNTNIKIHKQLSLLLNQLSQHLFSSEIISYILSIQRSKLIIIPHGFLHLFPIHAFYIEDRRSLIDFFKEGISYLPNCQILKLVKQQNNSSWNNFLGIYNTDIFIGYSGYEIKNISRYFPSIEVIEGKDINNITTSKMLSLAHCIHFSCHGVFNLRSPIESGLYLTGSELTPESKKLTLGEIFELPLKECNLVTLSASNTGFTDFLSLSEEYIGLPYGFLYAGSSTVISSLWQVSDLSTAILMIRFYQNLIDNKNVPIALNQAQTWLRDLTVREFNKWIEESKLTLPPTIKITLRRTIGKLPSNNCPFHDPYYWAAFCAIGQ